MKAAIKSQIHYFREIFFLFLWISFSVPAWADTELLPGAERDLVIETCTACHSSAIIRQNHMSRERWDETITWMQEKQGLMELSPEIRKRILNYLSSAQGVGSKNSEPGQKIYDYDYPPNPL
ncbi:MAG: hypothetical protein COV66_09780 [Nitrospinae bacterium CG11_big_fil_rev_8_21_14_0_20_45_15]|nr:MAG: hypothetical protein COV66_09780 [Nitrospinae bacterium CG11_big_fil_rev_8_21_14_0_20_45_15]